MRRIAGALVAIVAAASMALPTAATAGVPRSEAVGRALVAELAAPKLGARASSALRDIVAGADPVTVLGAGNVRADGRLVVEIRASDTSALTALLGRRGVIQRVRGQDHRVAIDASALASMMAEPSIARIRARELLRSTATTTSQGAGSLGAGAHHAAGRRGAVSVAVIDGGFLGWQTARDAGELGPGTETKNLCMNQPFTADRHGTAVAEIVQDVAPDATIHLVCIEDRFDWALASDHLRARGITIANASLGTATSGFGDGREPAGSPFHIVEADRRAGILHVVSAGNEALDHWAGRFSDPNGDDIHEFGSGGSIITGFAVPGGGTARVVLRWDEFDGPQTDIDLVITDSVGSVVAVSDDDQFAGHDPVEASIVVNPSASSESLYQVSILRYAGTRAPDMDLFFEGAVSHVERVTAGRSIAEPATAPGALTVGAVCWQNELLQPYSSRGPTAAGVTKPDVVAFDAVSTSAYGTSSGGCNQGFTGTSAAAPHVAGALALVKAANPDRGPGELVVWFSRQALDKGTPGKDNGFGAGVLRLGRFHEIDGPISAADSPLDFYVAQVYRDFLFREASPAELDHWSDAFATGIGRDEFAATLAASEEWVRTVFDRMYRDTLGRGIDATGAVYWRDVYDSGRLLSEIAGFIYSSDEYHDRVGATPGGFIDSLFAALLGRTPGSEERRRWIDELSRRGRTDIAGTLYRSEEARRRRVALSYRDFLGRAPEAAGLAYWAEQLRTNDFVALAGFLTASDEYYDRAQRR